MAGRILIERKQFDEDSFVEFRVYSVPKSTNFPDGVKYSMSFVHKNECILRYDNERGKGHHKHFKGEESKIEFKSMKELMKKFLNDVGKMRRELK